VDTLNHENTEIFGYQEESMKMLTTIAGASLITLSGLASAEAQTAPVRGTPGSPFPYAAPNEVQIINGVPCRTMYDRQLGTRVPVACAGDVMARRVN
jgi:hypothetical protein